MSLEKFPFFFLNLSEREMNRETHHFYRFILRICIFSDVKSNCLNQN